MAKSMIAKENMFNKLMPSSVVKEKARETGTLPANSPANSKYPAEKTAPKAAVPVKEDVIKTPAAPVEDGGFVENLTASEIPDAPPEISNEVPDKKSGAFDIDALEAVPLTGEFPNEPILTNITEYIVSEKIDAVFDKFNSCKCERCRQDVTAIALNKLKPRYYVVTDEADLPALAAKQNGGDIMPTLVQSILTVMAHPRH